MIISSVNSDSCGCAIAIFIAIICGALSEGIENGNWEGFIILCIAVIVFVIYAVTSKKGDDIKLDKTLEINKTLESSSAFNDSHYDDIDDDDDDDDDDDNDWDEGDDDDDPFDVIDHTDYVLLVSAEEYHEVKSAILRLKKLCHRMSDNSAMRDFLLSRANDTDTLHGEYSKDQFMDFLKLMIGKDIVYLYEHMGYDAEVDYYSTEGQLLVVMLQAIDGGDELNSYKAFKHVIKDADVYSEQIRDNYETMFDIYKDQTEVGISAKGIDDFSLVMVIMCAQEEDKYMKDMRNALYKLAVAVSDASGRTETADAFLEEMIQRAKDDEDDASEDKMDSTDSSEPTATIEDLNELIGLQQVKTEVRAMKNFIEVNHRRELAGMKTPPVSYHCVFTGNPGTGKTTVARIVAGIYKELGILQKGHLVETDRSGLVAEYVGQTAVKTNKVIDTALDGVLFIDEAYSLVGAGKEDFGKEAIATLVKRMEDDRDRLVIILAGYENEMQQFIESNPGLRSRFNRYIHFEDYSAEELKQIYIKMLQKYDFVLQPDAEEILSLHFYNCVANKGKDFGNARYVRNLFERTIKAQAVRLADQPETDKSQLATITADDISTAIADNP